MSSSTSPTFLAARVEGGRALLLHLQGSGREARADHRVGEERGGDAGHRRVDRAVCRHVHARRSLTTVPSSRVRQCSCHDAVVFRSPVSRCWLSPAVAPPIRRCRRPVSPRPARHRSTSPKAAACFSATSRSERASAWGGDLTASWPHRRRRRGPRNSRRWVTALSSSRISADSDAQLQ